MATFAYGCAVSDISNSATAESLSGAKKWRAYATTCAWLPLPPLVLSLLLWSSLPPAYSPDVFWKDVPQWIGVPENVLRVLVFVIPALFPMGARTSRQHRGWLLYAIGLAAYAASYLVQIAAPNSAWSTSLVGFAAPAWTTLLWFGGIALIAGPAFFPKRLKAWHYGVMVCLFGVFHVLHTGVVASRSVGHEPALSCSECAGTGGRHGWVGS